MTKCPHCGVSVQDHDYKCWYCDSSISLSQDGNDQRSKIPEKRETSIDQVAENLLNGLLHFTDLFTQGIVDDRQSPLGGLEREDVFHELLILAFWNLSFLGFDRIVVASVITHFLSRFAERDTPDARRKESDFIDYRFGQYTDSWDKNSKEQNIFFSTIAQNLSPETKFDPAAWIPIIAFFSRLTDVNAEAFNTIRNTIKIVI